MWVADLDLPTHTQTVCERLLSTEETERARRFHFDQDRRRYTAARGILRLLIGRYLDLAPTDVVLRTDHCGKPYVAPERNARALQFNLSHSAGLALYGFTRHRRIGVDLEQVRSDVAFADIAAHHFPPGDVERLRALPAAEQAETFFTCWTRHEAFLKARGCGLAGEPAQAELALHPNELARILTDGARTSEAQWTAMTLTPATGFLGAVVVEGRDLPLRSWRWEIPIASSFAGRNRPVGPGEALDRQDRCTDCGSA